MSRNGEPSKTLYIANFPKDTQKQDLEELFSTYGKLVSLSILNKEKFSFAFADFETVEDARRVQEKLDQKPYRDMNMKVSFKEKKENVHSNYQKPNEYPTSTTHNGEFKAKPYGQKSSLGDTYPERKPERKNSRISDSSSSRSRNNSIEREVPRERSRSKGKRRQGSSEESSGRHQIKRRPKEVRPRSNSKEIEYKKGVYPSISSRQESSKTLYVEKEILELSKEVHFLTKRLDRMENKFEQFIQEFKYLEHKKR